VTASRGPRIGRPDRLAVLPGRGAAERFRRPFPGEGPPAVTHLLMMPAPVVSADSAKTRPEPGQVSKGARGPAWS
jgi:hypothetical protein